MSGGPFAFHDGLYGYGGGFPPFTPPACGVMERAQSRPYLRLAMGAYNEGRHPWLSPGSPPCLGTSRRGVPLRGAESSTDFSKKLEIARAVSLRIFEKEQSKKEAPTP